LKIKVELEMPKNIRGQEYNLVVIDEILKKNGLDKS